MTWAEIWHTEFAWNTVGAWTLGVLAFLVTFTVLPLVKRYIGAQRRKWAQAGRELPVAVDVVALLVDRTSKVFLFTTAVAFAFTQLEFPNHIERAVYVAIVVTFWFQIGLWGMAAVRYAVDKRGRRGAPLDPTLASSIDIIVFIAGLAVWTMAFLLALDNLGVQIKPLLAGLGIGGIAVALAVQTVLGDLLASMSIALDKPFTVGDSLQVDDLNGTVEHIGVKSTRIRSLTGEQIIIANADLLKSRLRNNSRLRERRASFMLNVAYGTPAEKMRAIPEIVREIVTAQPKTRFDRCHFMQYGEYAMRFEVVFFVTTPEYSVYADTMQTVNLAILERFEQLGIIFAFPARPFDPALFPKPRT
ncbi:MAG TPA: mechanosensitive ion channel family protein [Steroidobacteraceae bacterium]|jgi:small-conductance mechanosensitive channel|nr:mechanosensitive ion channel family protein [Steroidobacteraceae bacterium]